MKGLEFPKTVLKKKNKIGEFTFKIYYKIT